MYREGYVTVKVHDRHNGALVPPERMTVAAPVMAAFLAVRRAPREPVSMGADVLTQFNDLAAAEARQALLACCSSPSWADRMTAARPYSSPRDAVIVSGQIIDAMTVADLTDALAGHPRIGARPDPEHAPARSAEWSRQEQALVSATNAHASRELAEANLEYERRFGHIYLVCASGRTALELLALLHGRLGNEPAAEWQVVRTELQKINEIRLAQLLEGSP
jgi:2-oxo-4-hydroxy-4-carboxy-5-ureidoimidazoline decarboxylase